MRIILALGGNSLLSKGEKGTAKEQRKNVAKTCKAIARIVNGGNEVVITHGNGPQVGNLLIQQESAGKKVAKMPLDVCDAMTQGELGYLIQSELQRVVPKTVATIITQVVVDKRDCAFRKPTKPVGPFYKKKMAPGMVMDAGRGWRKVVPSPKPLHVVEIEAIKALVRRGIITIACGGGGIPVLKDKRKLEGVEAVIDKDRASALIGKELKADLLIIATSIDRAYENFGKKGAKGIGRMRIREAEKLMHHFAEGSMRPKVEAGAEFVKNGGKKAVICALGDIEKAFAGKAGTTIVK
jgi:carbamate kinase